MDLTKIKKEIERQQRAIDKRREVIEKDQQTIDKMYAALYLEVSADVVEKVTRKIPNTPPEPRTAPDSPATRREKMSRAQWETSFPKSGGKSTAKQQQTNGSAEVQPVAPKRRRGRPRKNQGIANAGA